MTTDKLMKALFSRSRGAILTALTEVENEGLDLREISRRAGLDAKTVM